MNLRGRLKTENMIILKKKSMTLVVVKNATKKSKIANGFS